MVKAVWSGIRRTHGVARQSPEVVPLAEIREAEPVVGVGTVGRRALSGLARSRSTAWARAASAPAATSARTPTSVPPAKPSSDEFQVGFYRLPSKVGEIT